MYLIKIPIYIQACNLEKIYNRNPPPPSNNYTVICFSPMTKKNLQTSDCSLRNVDSQELDKTGNRESIHKERLAISHI